MTKINKVLEIKKIKNKFFFCINKKKMKHPWQVKGSAEAKERMAKLRAMRKKHGKK